MFSFTMLEVESTDFYVDPADLLGAFMISVNLYTFYIEIFMLNIMFICT